jgi:Na+/serine symporter
MKLFKSPIVMIILGMVAGVALSDHIKPMLSKVPLIGGLFNSTSKEA